LFTTIQCRTSLCRIRRLGITRTRNCAVFHITTRPREREARRINDHELGRRLVPRERTRAIPDG
jgi:hypothetical protein